MLMKKIKNIFNTENFLIILLIVTLILSIILGVISYFYGNIELFINYSGAVIGSILGVGGAYYVLKLQLQEDNKRELREKEPYVIAAEKAIDKFTYSIERKDLNNLSAFTIPLVNAGSTPVYDISYEYELEGYDQFLSKYKTTYELDKKDKKFPTIEWFEREEIKITKPGMFEKLPNNYNSDTNRMAMPPRYTILYSNKDFDYRHFPVEKTYETAVILSGEKYDLKIPEFVILLWKYKLYNDSLRVKYMRKINEIELPDLKMTIRYKNYRHENKMGLIVMTFKTQPINPREDFVSAQITPIYQKIESI